MDTSVNFARIDSILNPEDGKLPFCYYAPQTDGKVTWTCGYDANNKIVSVFKYDDGISPQKIPNYLKDMDEAISTKNTLISEGWLKSKPPEITVAYEDGTKKPLNRTQKRKLAADLRTMDKKNPFQGEGDAK